jgi:hypothetical protein
MFHLNSDYYNQFCEHTYSQIFNLIKDAVGKDPMIQYAVDAILASGVCEALANALQFLIENASKDVTITRVSSHS